MTNEAREASEAATPPGVRLDWRTGQPMLQHDDAFWGDHERQRVEQGLSVPQYCAANGLALSTFRHRVNGKKRASASPRPTKPALSQPPAFVAVSAPRPTSTALVEVALEGMTLRLSGEAADRVLASVMARLA